MHEYDTILKRLLMRFSPAAAAQLTGFEVRRWLNVELPELRNLRVDLLGETSGGELFHLELQSRNDPDIARRMLEYALAIYGLYRRRPEQLVLYTGEAPMRMAGRFVEFGFDCRIADIREFDPEPLLASPSLADNVVTILMRHRDQRRRWRGCSEKSPGPDRRNGRRRWLRYLFLPGSGGSHRWYERKLRRCRYWTTSWTMSYWVR